MSDLEKPKSVVVADGVCPSCDHPAVVKANKKGHLYIYCLTPADGGCGTGLTSRSDSGDVRIARQFVKKWRKPEYRAAYLDGAAEVEQKKVAPDPVEQKVDPPKPEPEPEVEETFP